MKKVMMFVGAALLSLSFSNLANSEEVDLKSAINNAKTDQEKVDILYSSGKKLMLTNYVLNKKMLIESPNKLSPEQGGQFVPQLDEFLDLYLDFLDQGMQPMEAIMMTHVSPQAVELVKQYQANKEKS